MNFPDVRHEMPFHSLHRAKILEMELCLCANLRARATNLLWQNNVFCQALRMQVAKKTPNDIASTRTGADYIAWTELGAGEPVQATSCLLRTKSQI